MNSYDSNFATYEIAAKALLYKDNQILLLTQSGDGAYDFPGGRMDKSEMELELTDILTREIKEELGPSVKFKVRDIAFVSKRYYMSHSQEHNILAIYFNVDYLSGDISISDEHTNFSWVDPKSILAHPDRFTTKNEYLSYKKFIQTNRIRG
jgi:8-oxo-dGTP pyrophosphatase MutT (NUDIX family)